MRFAFRTAGVDAVTVGFKNTQEIDEALSATPMWSERIPLRRRPRGLATLFVAIQSNVSSEEVAMQVSKWGNSLAVRLPASVVEALDLKDGDQIEVRIAGPREFEISRDPSREQALERLRRLRRPLPTGFTFDRIEMNER
jgi:antitoxin MazE